MSNKTTVPAQQAAAISVVLLKPHTHAGQDYAAGESIQVTAETQAWLQATGVVGTQEDQHHG
ncbi:MAG: hypothetical protein Q8R10_19565 [Pseudomonas sp.]|uniref:DUF7210 family protein n=1 Tax=Pseudomonas sp. TaxID=306 RepID=UPI00273555B7|nr:hypothetical protein [Pseudomonas sp.]MDP3848623.1 hypothetical protein [Pseudomonas sp.]